MNFKFRVLSIFLVLSILFPWGQIFANAQQTTSDMNRIHGSFYGFDDENMMITEIYETTQVDVFIQDIRDYGFNDNVLVLKDDVNVIAGNMEEGMKVQIYCSGGLCIEYTVGSLLTLSIYPRASSGYGFIMPVDNMNLIHGWEVGKNISSGFQPSDRPTHNGIDISNFPPTSEYPNSYGRPIRAVKSGIVIVAVTERDGGAAGNYVEISHGNGMTTRYLHMRDPSLFKVGESVSQGDVIGFIGKTGGNYGAHLHFEVRINNIPQNPIQYLTEAPTWNGQPPDPPRPNDDELEISYPRPTEDFWMGTAPNAEDVKWLQSALNKLNERGLIADAPILAVDGQFGENTDGVLIKFQEEYDLAVTGSCNNETRNRIVDLLKNGPPPPIPSESSFITGFYRVIKGPVTVRDEPSFTAESYGTMTDGSEFKIDQVEVNSVYNYDLKKYITYGKISSVVTLAIHSTCPSDVADYKWIELDFCEYIPLQPDEDCPEHGVHRRPTEDFYMGAAPNAEDVKWLQCTLNKIMDSGLDVNGDFNNETDRALLDFQIKQGLTVNGVCNTETREKIIEMLYNPDNTEMYSITFDFDAGFLNKDYTREVNEYVQGPGMSLAYEICLNGNVYREIENYAGVSTVRIPKTDNNDIYSANIYEVYEEEKQLIYTIPDIIKGNMDDENIRGMVPSTGVVGETEDAVYKIDPYTSVYYYGHSGLEGENSKTNIKYNLKLYNAPNEMLWEYGGKSVPFEVIGKQKGENQNTICIKFYEYGDIDQENGLNLKDLAYLLELCIGNLVDDKGSFLDGLIPEFIIRKDGNLQKMNASIPETDDELTEILGGFFQTMIEDRARLIDSERVDSYHQNDMNININNPIMSDSTAKLYGNVTLNADLMAADDIIISRGDLTNGVNFHTSERVLYSRNGNITIDADNMTFDGIIYAPNGKVTVDAQSVTVNGIIIAKEVEIIGQNVNVDIEKFENMTVLDWYLSETGLLNDLSVSFENGGFDNSTGDEFSKYFKFVLGDIDMNDVIGLSDLGVVLEIVISQIVLAPYVVYYNTPPQEKPFEEYPVSVSEGMHYYSEPAGAYAGEIESTTLYTIVEERTAYDKKWGKLKSGAGWINLDALSSTLAINDVTEIPGTIPCGSLVYIYGAVTSNYEITSLTVGVHSEDGTIHTYATAAPYADSYDIHILDAKIEFNKVPAGSHYFRVVAEDSSGCVRTLNRQYFTVE